MNSQPRDHRAASVPGRMIEHADETNVEARNGQKLAEVVYWLKYMFPLLKIPADVSVEELRVILNDGAVLCNILNRSNPGLILEIQTSSAEQRLENVKKFLVAVEEMGLPRFRPSDLDQGSMAAVIDCLFALKDHLDPDRSGNFLRKKWKPETENFEVVGSSQTDQSTRRQYSRMWGEERRKSFTEKFQRAPRNSRAPDTGATTSGHKFHEVFQPKQGRYADLPASKISEMLKSTSLDNAPTQSLLSVVNGILDESVERKNGEIPQRVACLLRRVVQEIERRISTQAEHIRNQNNLLKAREEKYQSRIRVLETLATGTSEEAQIVMNQLQQMKVEKTKIEQRKKFEEQDVVRLVKEKTNSNLAIAALKEEMETTKNNKESSDLIIAALKEEVETTKKNKENSDIVIAALKEEMETTKKNKENSDLVIAALKEEMETTKKNKENSDLVIAALKEEVETTKKNKENRDLVIAVLKEEMETTRKTGEERCTELEQEVKKAKMDLEAKKLKMETEESKTVRIELEEVKKEKIELEKRLKVVECLSEESRNRAKELEEVLMSTLQSCRKKEHSYQNFIGIQINALQEMRVASGSIRREIATSENTWKQEMNIMGSKLKQLGEAAKIHNLVLAENRKLYNEVQDLKGNIRVYCRIRPFLPGETQKQTTLEHIGDNGELVISNPFKQGKDGNRGFKFDKVFGPKASQAEVFADTQPLVRSVLDGYNVCIFAYGQTGSGKTYTMTGPEAASEEEWGVNYRALNDLFQISCNRKGSFAYEVGVQMVEIYNEQVRDLLLTGDNASRRLGILSTSQSNGLAVPDASMHPVESTKDVIQLMEFGHTNRSVSATALNQRSSRSHSVVTVHVRGSDLETSSILRGSLHLVDLAGSERVDRSEVTGERLKEAQHINKSLSALGDVIFALAQKNAHVPYRNSKLTQLLQTSLGGQAKTLMFVQINPNVDSFSESLSALKFAERVSGVELGAARSNKESKDVRELMDQVASLKDMIARKDEEIERLQLIKGTHSPNGGLNALRNRPPSPVKASLRGSPSQNQRLSSLRTTRSSERLAPDQETDWSDRDASPQEYLDEMRKQKLSGEMDTGQNIAVTQILGLNRADSEGKLSDVSDGGVSVESDGSAEGTTERPSSEQKGKLPSQAPRPPQKSMQVTSPSVRPASKVTSKVLTTSRKSTLITAPSSSSRIGLTSQATGSPGKPGSISPGRGISSKMASASIPTGSSSRMISTSPSRKAVSRKWT